MSNQPAGENQRTRGTAEKALDVRVAAWQLRLQGYTYREIAVALGKELKKPGPLSTKTVHKYIAKETERRKALLDETREAVIAIELARLDRMLTKLEGKFDKATTPNEAARLSDSMLKIGERRAKLLGLDKPTKVDITDSRRPYENRTIGELEDELARTEAQLRDAESRKRAVH